MAENLPDTNVGNIEYIIKQDAINCIEHMTWYHVNRKGQLVDGANSDTGLYKAKDVYKGLHDIPSADVVPVVRCKDCEWAMKSTELPGWYMCKCEEAFDYYAKPDDFCSHGERRE